MQANGGDQRHAPRLQDPHRHDVRHHHRLKPVKPLVSHRRPFRNPLPVGINLMPYNPLSQPDRFLNPHHIKLQPAAVGSRLQLNPVPAACCRLVRRPVRR